MCGSPESSDSPTAASRWLASPSRSHSTGSAGRSLRSWGLPLDPCGPPDWLLLGVEGRPGNPRPGPRQSVIRQGRVVLYGEIGDVIRAASQRALEDRVQSGARTSRSDLCTDMTWGRRNVPKRSSEFLFAINRPRHQIRRCGWQPAAPGGLCKADGQRARRHRDGGPLHVRRRRDLCHSQQFRLRNRQAPIMQIDCAALTESPELR